MLHRHAWRFLDAQDMRSCCARTRWTQTA